ncbi:MAG: hypothetical protein F8N37_09650 [Telmatospirillum sp.]|nr:hypothetical protein [Telmatospirillum sp.]
MLVLGVSDRANAAAVLVSPDGALRGLQEERPLRRKNAGGPPIRSIGWLLADNGLTPADIDELALVDRMPDPGALSLAQRFRRGDDWRDRFRDKAGEFAKALFPAARSLARQRLEPYLALGFAAGRIRTYDHHDCHAATAYHGWGRYDRPILVVTCDGDGDGLCATVSVGRDGRLERIAAIDASQSLGHLFSLVTFLTGMTPNEHEYKLMGMAPYAQPGAAARIRDRLLGLFDWDGSGRPLWRRRPGVPPVPAMRRTVERLFAEERFDAVMGGTQLFMEAMLCEWIRRAIRLTGIREVAAAGGVFMNVKANKAVMEMEEVADLFVFPSCGDETGALGALYLARAAGAGVAGVPPLSTFYLGPDWDDDGIEEILAPLVAESRITVERPQDLNRAIVDCLLQGEVVGRFAGREEFGARSLGNRALLADPRDPAVIPVINAMIKNRDFWMPFACSVQEEHAKRYLINPKSLPAPYMILSFDTTRDGQSDLRAGIHPYDHSCRPQVVRRQDNPPFWALIEAFRRETGVAGLLNTSLNLHGLPLAHRPADALEVMFHSGLRRLAIGPFLVRKVAP